MSKNITKTLLAVLLTACITFAAAFAFYSYKIVPEQKSTEEQLKTLNDIMNANLHMVYIAATDLKAGEVLDAEDVILDSQYVTNIGAMITAEDIGKILITDIPSGNTIHKALLTEIKSAGNEWLVEYSCFRLSPNMTKGTYVDVRIRYQNGEDYVVLSKKQIQNIEENSCYLAVVAEEMQMMASAIVDANLYDASIYTTLYTEPTIQEAVPVTYIPNFANPELYPNTYSEEAMQLRKALVTRISNSFSIDAGNTNDTTFGENIDNTSPVPVQ